MCRWLNVRAKQESHSLDLACTSLSCLPLENISLKRSGIQYNTVCWEQTENLLLYWFFLGLIIFSESEVIKLGGQSFVLFIFLLSFCPIESSSSAPLHFCSSLQEWSGLLFFQDYILTFISPFTKSHPCMASPLPAWGLLFCTDPNLLGLYKSLSTFAESLDGKSHLGREETILRNNWSQRPKCRCEYYPLLQPGIYCLLVLSHGLKLIAEHAALIVGVNILHYFFLVNGALSSG